MQSTRFWGWFILALIAVAVAFTALPVGAFELGKAYRSQELFCFNKNDATALIGMIDRNDHEAGRVLFAKKTCFMGEVIVVYSMKVHSDKFKDGTPANIYKGVLYRSDGQSVADIWVLTDEESIVKGII